MVVSLGSFLHSRKCKKLIPTLREFQKSVFYIHQNVRKSFLQYSGYASQFFTFMKMQETCVFVVKKCIKYTLGKKVYLKVLWEVTIAFNLNILKKIRKKIDLILFLPNPTIHQWQKSVSEQGKTICNGNNILWKGI